MLQHHLIPLNETTEDVTLYLELNSIGNMYWTFMMTFQQSFEMQKGNGLMGVRTTSRALCIAREPCSVASCSRRLFPKVSSIAQFE